MMRRAVWPVMAAFLLLALGPSSAFAQQGQLRYQFRSERRACLETRLEQTVEQETGGAPVHSRMVQEVRQTFEVLSVLGSGRGTLRFTTDTLRIRTDSALGEFRFNSEVDDPKDVPELEVAAVACLLNQPLEVEVDPDGRFVRLSGLEDAVKRSSEKIDGKALAELVESDLRQFFVRLPDDPIRVGGTWEAYVEKPVEEAGVLRYTFAYTLQALEEVAGAPQARLAVDLRAEYRPAAGGLETIELLQSRGQGELLLDLALGIPRAFELEQELSIRVQGAGGLFVRTIRQRFEGEVVD